MIRLLARLREKLRGDRRAEPRQDRPARRVLSERQESGGDDRGRYGFGRRAHRPDPKGRYGFDNDANRWAHRP
jgi:hypothetical protein